LYLKREKPVLEILQCGFKLFSAHQDDIVLNRT